MNQEHIKETVIQVFSELKINFDSSEANYVDDTFTSVLEAITRIVSELQAYEGL